MELWPVSQAPFLFSAVEQCPIRRVVSCSSLDRSSLCSSALGFNSVEADVQICFSKLGVPPPLTYRGSSVLHFSCRRGRRFEAPLGWVFSCCCPSSSSSRARSPHLAFEVDRAPVPYTPASFGIAERFASGLPFLYPSAPNTRIGGSGAWAEGFEAMFGPVFSFPTWEAFGAHVSMLLPLVFYNLLEVAWGLFWSGGEISLGFFRSLLVLVLFALVTALLPNLRRLPLVGRCCRSLFLAPVRSLRALGIASPSLPVLDWQPTCNRPVRRARVMPQGGFLAGWVRFWFFFVGISCLPCQVWAAPKELALLQQLRDCVEAATDHTRVPADTFPSPLDAATRKPAVDSPIGACIDPPSRHDPDGLPSGEWLGITLYAPYYQTTAFGMRLESGCDLAQIHSAIRTAGRLPCDELDELVAVYPQVLPGYLSVVAFSSIMAQGRRPHCVVILDLGRVGSSCFAAVVPMDLCLDDLWDGIGKLFNIDVHDTPVYVWVGDAQQPASAKGSP